MFSLRREESHDDLPESFIGSPNSFQTSQLLNLKQFRKDFPLCLITHCGGNGEYFVKMKTAENMAVQVHNWIKNHNMYVLNFVSSFF